MNQLWDQLANYSDPTKTTFILNQRASHTFPTDLDGSGNNPCSRSARPFISNCGYDGAGEVLKWMYGSLAAKNNDALTGKVLSYDQSGSFRAAGMGSTGYVYLCVLTPPWTSWSSR